MVKGVLDNYHQSLSELREIAYYEVHNEDVGKAMQNAALLLGKGEPRSFEKVYEICPGSDGWNELRKQLYIASSSSPLFSKHSFYQNSPVRITLGDSLRFSPK